MYLRSGLPKVNSHTTLDAALPNSRRTSKATIVPWLCELITICATSSRALSRNSASRTKSRTRSRRSLRAT